jgi:predicted phosphodiesterase
MGIIMDRFSKEFLKNATDAIEILKKRRIFEKIESKYPLAVIGDIHGYTESLENFEKIIHDSSPNEIIFLGDYVDRGFEGVEVLNEIFNLLINYKDKTILIRGNHEDLNINKEYGFYEELISKIGKEGINTITLFYSNLPISISINNIFFVHGGIPYIKSNDKPAILKLEDIYSLDKIKGKKEYLEFENNVLFQMVWNDPDGYIDWFEPNYVRGDGVFYYGKKAWNEFMNANNIDLIVRGHEIVDGIHIWKQDGTFINKFKNNQRFYLDQIYKGVITVFSSRYHIGRAGSILIYKDEIEFIEL